MIKEFRKISKGAIRELCIKREWFTCGDNEDYEKLMKYGEKKNITTKDLEEMANIIIEYSDEDSLDYYSVEDVMFDLACECVSTFATI